MLNRRSMLTGAMAAMMTGLLTLRNALAQPANAHSGFIKRAFAMRRRAVAEGDQAYGAIVVKKGRVIGLGPSRVLTNMDATGHAEMEALRDAGRTLGTHDLSGCILYTTSLPCRMCETAAYWGNIERVYTGADITDRGKPGYGC
ncbi:MAG: nucleoside deaminase [Alphaproteobacteria bacterium]|nr:nucleoside deaminase [Alphaproteobacteria bacterium]